MGSGSSHRRAGLLLAHLEPSRRGSLAHLAKGSSSGDEGNDRTLLCGIYDEIRQFVAGNPELFPRARVCSIVKEAKVLIYLQLR